MCLCKNGSRPDCDLQLYHIQVRNRNNFTIPVAGVYKNKLLSAMESFVFFNITTFAVITLYNFSEVSNESKGVLQLVSAYVSVGTVVILCLVVTLVHVYRYGNSKIYASVKTSKIGQRLADLQISNDPSKHPTQTESNLLDVLDHPRSGDRFDDQPYGQLITASVLSLTECEETLDSTYHLKESEEKKCTNNKVEKTQTHYCEDSKVTVISGSRIEFHQKREAPIPLTSFDPSHADMTKPLLEDDELA